MLPEIRLSGNWVPSLAWPLLAEGEGSSRPAGAELQEGQGAERAHTAGQQAMEVDEEEVWEMWDSCYCPNGSYTQREVMRRVLLVRAANLALRAPILRPGQLASLRDSSRADEAIRRGGWEWRGSAAMGGLHGRRQAALGSGRPGCPPTVPLGLPPQPLPSAPHAFHPCARRGRHTAPPPGHVAAQREPGMQGAVVATAVPGPCACGASHFLSSRRPMT